jgi:hypothetical protein
VVDIAVSDAWEAMLGGQEAEGKESGQIWGIFGEARWEVRVVGS